MLNFSSLRQRAPELLLLSLPIGLSLVVHSVWISRSGAEPRVGDQQQSVSIDNTAQLVRITRRAAQQQTLAAVGLDLSGTLPPPAADVLQQIELPDPKPDCPPKQQRVITKVVPDASAPAASVAPEEETAQRQDTVVATAPNAPSQPLDGDGLDRLWGQAMGVPIWPDDLLGPKPVVGELRELSLGDVSGLDATDLHQRSVQAEAGTYLVKVFGDRVFLLREP
jgi:hypothetical protein